VAADDVVAGLRLDRPDRAGHGQRRVAVRMGGGQPRPVHLPSAAGLHRLDGGPHLLLRRRRRARRLRRGLRRAGLPGSRSRAVGPAQRARAGAVARGQHLPGRPGRGAGAVRRRRDRRLPHLRLERDRRAGREGRAAETTRSAVFDAGNIGNYSFTAIPYNAGDAEAAMVLATCCCRRRRRWSTPDRRAPASPQAIDLSRLPQEQAAEFERCSSRPTRCRRPTWLRPRCPR
jgi:hypothetical protein